MPFQWEAWNGDPFIAKEVLRLKEAHHLVVAVETGSCLFSTTRWLAEHFQFVHTVEVSEAIQQAGIHQIRGRLNVHAALGESAALLRAIGPQLGDDTLVFLDAHWGPHCPLLDELAAIAEARIHPVIVIHDMQVPGRPDLGYDTYQGRALTLDYVQPQLDRIYGVRGYFHHFNDRAGGAMRGVLYVTPRGA